jgi:hypothetical protein
LGIKQKADLDEIKEVNVRALFGAIDTNFAVHYSDMTGYLWTDEDLMVGGHDLLAELTSHTGKYLVLEVGLYNKYT